MKYPPAGPDFLDTAMSNNRNQAEEATAMEARAAAAKWDDINAACPYPWGSPQAIVFKREFLAARAHIERTEQQAMPGVEVAELEPSEALCQCASLEALTAQELETGLCQECGKAVVA